MSAAERAKTLRGLADASNRCLIALTDEEHEALEDAIALYEEGDEHCFECGKKLDAVAATQESGRDEPPGEGAATMCLGCGAIYGMSGALEIRELTLRERAELAGDHDAMRQLRAMNRKAHFARPRKALD